MRSVSAEALPAKGPRRPRVKLSLQPGPKGTWLIFLTRPVGNACQPFLGTGLFSLMFPAQQALDSFPSGSLLGRIVEHFSSQCIVYHCLFPWGALYLARWPSTILYTPQGVWGRGVGSLDSWQKKTQKSILSITVLLCTINADPHRQQGTPHCSLQYPRSIWVFPHHLTSCSYECPCPLLMMPATAGCWPHWASHWPSAQLWGNGSFPPVCKPCGARGSWTQEGGWASGHERTFENVWRC